MNKYINNVSEILIKNGFVIKNEEYVFYKNECAVKIHYKDGFFEDDGFYEVITEEGSIFSRTLDIYWLIGILIYYNHITELVK